MVLTNFGQYRSESAIRRVLGDPRFGITLTQAADRLLAAGTMTQGHADWGLDDIRASLRDGRYPIVGIERRFFGHPSATHAVVITAVQSSDIEMLDPPSSVPHHTLLPSQLLLSPGGVQARRYWYC
jgi:hypothetical protein